MRSKINFDKPAIYRICVQGLLDEHWSDRLGGMAIMVRTADDSRPITSLYGMLLDQAALLGVLNTLYDIHLPLLSVECVFVD